MKMGLYGYMRMNLAANMYFYLLIHSCMLMTGSIYMYVLHGKYAEVIASYPGLRTERGKGPGDTWQIPVCAESTVLIWVGESRLSITNYCIVIKFLNVGKSAAF